MSSPNLLLRAANESNVQLAGNGGGHRQSNQAGGQINGNEDGGYDRDETIRTYEAELNDALGWARIIGILHAVSQFLALCSLSWATVAILGAFLRDDLPLRDLLFVTGLVLLEAGRLASTSLFIRLLMRPLAYHSQDPRHISHARDGHYPRSDKARNWSYGVQSAFISPSLVLPILAFCFMDLKNRNLRISLIFFYCVVFLNSLVALANLICSGLAFGSLNKPPEQSILRYFDRVLENAISCGVVEADNFEFFGFAYTMLGNEYRRGVQPKAVAKNHKKLIKYVYAHRLGVDFLQIYLDAGDGFVQLAAVNMVGFWVEQKWGVGLGSQVALPDKVLMKLVDKVGMGQLGWAANTCIGVLAQTPKWAHTLAKMKTGSGCSLMDCLVDIVDASSARSLSTVRTLTQLYEQLCVNQQHPPMPFIDDGSNLVPKLEKLAKENKVHRLRVHAAYLLLLMAIPCNRTVILGIVPTEDKYWFRSEASMLKVLREHIDVPAFTFPPAFVEENTDINTPTWAIRTSSAL